MPRRHLVPLLMMLVWALLSAPAAADMSGCSSAALKDDPHDQIRLYTLCIESGLRRSNRAGAYNNRGVAYLAIGDVDSALSDFTRAIENDDDWGMWYLNRAEIYASRGQYELALEDLAEAVRLRPSRIRGAAHALRAQLRTEMGNYAGALEDLNEFVRRDRRDWRSHNAKAAWLASVPDARFRNGAEAVEAATRAVELEDSPMSRTTLAAAYAEAGRFEDAVREQETAMRGWEALGVKPEGLSELLALYRSGNAVPLEPIEDATTTSAVAGP